MKKIVLILIGIITLLAIPATVFLSMRSQELRKKAAPATTLTLSPTTVTKKIGDEFTLEAKINTGDNQAIATEINLIFDATKLEAISITNGAAFPNILSSGSVGAGTASIAVGAANTTTPVKGAGTAAVIKFKALAATTSPISIKFSPETFVGALGESTTNVLVSSIPATISITTATGTTGTPPTPNTTITPSVSLTPTLAASSSASASASVTSSALQITSPTSNEALVTKQPTIKGKGPPNSTVTITIYSEPQTVTVVTDANGNWSYAVPAPLAAGPHTIVIAALDPTTNQTKTATLAFVVSDGLENGASGSAMPVSGVIEQTLLLLFIGVTFIIAGAILPMISTHKL
ncbi:MAG: Ig-like domain-containing protein [Patescibacteria group bacterium]